MHIASARRGDHVGCSREDGHSVGCPSAVDAVGIGNRDRLDSGVKQGPDTQVNAVVAETNGQHQNHDSVARLGGAGKGRPSGH